MNKIKSIEVFGQLIFESDAVAFLALCKDQKKEWILQHTNQRDENLIDEFVNNPNITKECKCLDCGKNKQDVNISETVPTEIETSNEVASTSTDSKRTSTKRRGNDKTT